MQWYLILRQEDRERIFENRGLRGIFGNKGKDVIEGWRMLLNCELSNILETRKIQNFN